MYVIEDFSSLHSTWFLINFVFILASGRYDAAKGTEGCLQFAFNLHN
jgi:hypothetical protein